MGDDGGNAGRPADTPAGGRMHAHHRIPGLALAAGLLAGTGCGDSTGPGTAGREVNEYLLALPSWSAFSPSEPDQAPTATGATVTLPDDTLDVVAIGDTGQVTVIPDVVYACTETPYNLRENPQQIVMYSPDVEILWPGSLIQGRSHRDGLGALLGLTIAERTPIRVSIPSLPTGGNFREVTTPDQATVGAAIGEMLGDATAQGLATPSTITFQQTVSYSEQQLALAIGISGRYLGFSASASANFDRKASETTITAQFYQKMFEVVLAPPQTPASFFSADFTREKLDQQIALGKLGPDNIPVYVSNVVYGRMMMFSLTSTASETEIRGTLQAAYNAIAGEVSTSLSAKQKTILQESQISVTSLGGDAEATIAVIRSGDWSQYFTNVAPLSSAAPLSYTFRNLADGSIAGVTETTEYNLKTCAARASTPGAFNFLALQSATLGIPTPVRTLVGDVNGDGRQDLIWNHAGASNQVQVGFGNPDGTLTIAAASSHPESPSEGWANYVPVVGDFNGDGDSDMAWTYLASGPNGNRTYLGLSNGDGTFGFPSVRLQAGNWPGYRALVGDVTNDGNDDLIWNVLGATNRVYSGVSNGVSSFTLVGPQDHPSGGWTPYTAFVGDVDGNQRADIIWRSGLRSYFARSNGDGTFLLPATPLDNTRPLGTLTRYVHQVGDVDGDGRTDVIWVDTTANSVNTVAVGLANATGTGLTFPAPADAGFNSAVALRVRIGDVNADGQVDLVWNSTGATNRVYASLGKTDGTFDFSPQNQLHPATGIDWDQFTMLVADVNGDGRSDVIWNHPAATNRVYVAIGKQQP
jgi:hypothetical protein